MKKLLFLLLLPSYLGAQGLQGRVGSTLPNQCTPARGDLFFKTATPNAGLYECLAVNTWTLFGTVGTGAITGSTGSTDNAIIRADGTGGFLIQPSNATIDDSGNLTAAIRDKGGQLFNAKAYLSCDGVTDDTAALASIITSNRTIVIPHDCGNILVGTGITTGQFAIDIADIANFTLKNEPNGGPGQGIGPRLVWNGSGGKLFRFMGSQSIHLEALIVLANNHKFDGLVTFDGPPNAFTPTQNRVTDTYIDGVTQPVLNNDFVAIDIAPTTTFNHENYLISGNDIYCPGYQTTSFKLGTVNGTTTVTCPTCNLTGADIGTPIRVSNATNLFTSTIATVSDPTHFTVGSAVTFTDASGNARIHFGRGAGIGIQNNSPNAKNQLFERNNFTYCAKGIAIWVGSAKISQVGGFRNDTDIWIDQINEPIDIDYLQTEESLIGIDSGEKRTPITIRHWRMENANALANGFAVIDGMFTVETAKLIADPANTHVFRDKATGNLVFRSYRSNYTPASGTTTLANLGLTAMAATAYNVTSDGDIGISDQASYLSVTKGPTWPLKIVGNAGGGTYLGAYDSTIGGLWSANVTPSTSNYTIIGDGNNTFLNVGASGDLTIFKQDATALFVLKNNGMLDFGGTSGSFPALKRSSAILQARLADDSAFANFQALGGSFGAAVTPTADDGAALGSTSLKWSDLFLASGAVVNFNSGDVTMTHSAGQLTLTSSATDRPFKVNGSAGGGFYLGSLTATIGGIWSTNVTPSATNYSVQTNGNDFIANVGATGTFNVYKQDATYLITVQNDGRLTFGGISSSFPALKQNGTELQARLADDTNFASLKSLNVVYAAGGALQTSTSAGNTALFQAYDVDGAAYKTFATLTANNTPSFAIAAPAGATLTVSSDTYSTTTNCADGAGAAACGSAAAGAFVIDAGTSNTVVSTTAVTANSEILIQEDSSLGTRLSATCNTTTGRDYTVTARTAGTSFTVTASANPTTNPACLNYLVIN